MTMIHETEAPSGCAIVTGGSAGVGRAVVERLIGRGHRVGVLARGEDRLQEMEREFGREWVRGVGADVADQGAVDAAADEVVDAFGAPTIWVNSAMLTSYSPFRDMPAVEFDTIVGATFTGQVNGVRTALRVMDGAREGSIVCIGSGLSYRAVPMQSAYVAAKHAINGFAQSLRSELLAEESPIALSLVQLPAINTPQFDWARNRMDDHPQPAPPIYQPDVAARAVMKAIDGGNREILVGKPVLQLIFGDMVAPWLFDRQLAKSGAEMQQTEERDHPELGPNTYGPATRHSSAKGSFGDRAKDGGLIVDSDVARGAAFLGVPLAAMAVGALGAAMAGRRR